MGNSTSNDKRQGKAFAYGSVEIFTEHNLYYPGEGISGAAKLTLAQPFPSNSFVIQIKGVEKAIIVQNSNLKGFSAPPPKEFKDKHILTTNQIVIKSPQPDCFPAGTYNYPFAFQLDSFLPSSFAHEMKKDPDTAKAKISYKIVCGLFDSRSSLFLVKKLPFQVTSIRQIVDQRLEFKTKINLPGITSMIWSNTIALSISLRDNKIVAGEEFQVLLGIDAKDSNRSVHATMLELVQTVTIQVHGQRTVNQYVIWQKQLAQKIKKKASHVGAEGFTITVPPSVTKSLVESNSTKNIENAYDLRLTVSPEKSLLEGMFGKSGELLARVQLIRKRPFVPQRIILQHDQMAQMSQMNQFAMQNAMGGQPGYPPQPRPAPLPSPLPAEPTTQIPIYQLNMDSIENNDPGQNRVGLPENDFRVSYPSLEEEH